MPAKRNVPFPLLHDREWLHERYVERAMTMKQIAAEIGCARTAVIYALRRCEIPSRGRTGPPPVVRVGQKFGALLVLEFAGTGQRANGTTYRTYRCRCDCGDETITSGAALNHGTDSCVRCSNRTHGHTVGRKPTPTYGSWCSMNRRCEDPSVPGWEYYGGRGITVCARWRGSFLNFLADMGERPVGHTLDRINNDRNYEPGNVRWATPQQQADNRRPQRRRH